MHAPDAAPAPPPTALLVPVAVDIVALTIIDARLNVLVVDRALEPFKGEAALPGGFLLAGEQTMDAARRELAEETDYVAATWNTLAEFYASPGFTTEGARIFLAQDLSLLPEYQRTAREDEEAEFVPTWVRLDEALDAVMDGRRHNPSTVLGVLATAQARARGWAGLRPADAPWLRSPESL